MKTKLFLIITALLLLSSNIFAKETIIWVYIDYPPRYIEIEGKEDSPEGIGPDAIDLIAKNMPDYNHVLKLKPFARILEDLKRGENVCFFGLVKNPERLKFIHYSIACGLDTPEVLFVRKKDLEKFGGGKPVFFRKLLENKELIFVKKKGHSHGASVDAVLDDFKDAPNIKYLFSAEHGQEFEMVRRGYADYTIGAADGIYALKKLGYLDTEVSVVPMLEKPDWTLYYVGAPKTPWGREFIAKLNKVLEKLIHTEEFYNIHKTLVNKDLLPELRKQYDMYVLNKK